MQMAIQAAAFTPLCDNGKVGLSHEAHKQQDVDVASLPVKDTNSNCVKNFTASSDGPVKSLCDN